ncbi:MAG: hypothetical protein IT555_05700 [Acetobacteraceae bacterium]|nr:hypothetical protein [Acetobacteraceae bacterium]
MLAALALLLRLALPQAAAMPAPADALGELLAGGGICHGDPDAGGDPAPAAACLLCPLCAGPAPVLAATPLPVPLPAIALAVPRGLRPPALAPPLAGYNAARPRGPPALPA